jgi:hypothetical protein
VLGPGGEFRAVAPHLTNPHFYCATTHSTFFGPYTLSYLSVRRPGLRRIERDGACDRDALLLSAVHIAEGISHVPLSACSRNVNPLAEVMVTAELSRIRGASGPTSFRIDAVFTAVQGVRRLT